MNRDEVRKSLIMPTLDYRYRDTNITSRYNDLKVVKFFSDGCIKMCPDTDELEITYQGIDHVTKTVLVIKLDPETRKVSKIEIINPIESGFNGVLQFPCNLDLDAILLAYDEMQKLKNDV